ncbi:DUF6527 family protein [Sulfitobacter geojensis]|uniref:DUF6527 family protein n=1 Tax=Sulfitobacter geojensis TaxID=1342299 RepID=UPI003B8A657B
MKFPFWFRKLWQRHGPKRKLIIVDGDTPPETLSTRHLYVCRDEGENWSAAMSCPCGCGDKLELMLLKEVKPNWTLKTDDQSPPSLHPSVWRKSGCEAHFWLRDGHIQWC